MYWSKIRLIKFAWPIPILLLALLTLQPANAASHKPTPSKLRTSTPTATAKATLTRTPQSTATRTSTPRPTATFTPTSPQTITKTPTTQPTAASTATRTIASAGTRYGVMLPGQMTLANQTLVMQQLGVAYYRANALYMTSPDNPRPDIDKMTAAGYKVLMVIRASGENGTPSNPPADLNIFKSGLQGVLSRYHPAYMVVEDEQDNSAVYTGTAQQYLDELTAACAVARPLGIPCVPGGLTSESVIWLKVRGMLAAGQGSAALAYVQHTYPYLMPDGPVPNFQTTADLQRAVNNNAATLDRAQAMLDGYPGAGVNYVNFHWYAPDSQALTGAIDYMRSASHGITVLSDEMGQRDNDPSHTTAVLSTARDLGLPLVMWFSIDCAPPNGARALTEIDGTFRATGQAFATFIATAASIVRTQVLALPLVMAN